MSTDFRALCEELAEKLDALNCSYNIPSQSALVERARTALAQPEPVAPTPTDEEIEQWADASSEVPLEEMDPDIHGWRRCFTPKEFSGTIRAALARWGTP
jgi:hypothetical protein